MSAFGRLIAFGSGKSLDRAARAAKQRKGTSRRSKWKHGTGIRASSLEQLEDRLLLTTLTTLTTDLLDLTLDTTGYVTSVADHRSPNTNLLSGSATPFAKVEVSGTWYDCTSATFADDTLHFRFATCPTNYDLAVEVQQSPAQSDYLVFTVDSLTPSLPGEVQMLNFSTTVTTFGSDFAGFAANSSFAIFVRAFSPAGAVGVNPFRNEFTQSNHIVGESFALGGSTYGNGGSAVLDSLKNLITTEGLLTSSVGGPWAQDAGATINRESYLFAFDLGESNVSQWISLAQQGGIGIILMSSWWQTLGHYAPSSTLFPNGVSGLTSVVNQIHAAGLKVGFHTLSTLISSDDSYVTPTPDSRLGKDTSFTLTSNITSTATTIYVNETIEGLQTVWGSGGGNVLQIGNELIQYTGYTNNGAQHYFIGCTRGAFGTSNASHSSGATVYHVYTNMGYFVGDPETTLFDEIGTALAARINLGVDMVYLDGLDIGLSEYARMKEAGDIFEKIDHAVRIETASWTPYTWTFNSVIGALDFPFWGDKSFIDMHANYQNYYKNSLLMLGQLGWYSLRSSSANDYDSLFPDEFEYLCTKTTAHDVSVSFQNLTPTASNGRQSEYLATLNKWNSIILDAATKVEMQALESDYHLITLPDGSLQIVETDYEKHKVTAVDNGSQAWTALNQFDAQHPTIRIEALYGVEPYSYGTQCLTDGSADTIWTATNVTASWAWDTNVIPPGESGSTLFSATNNSGTRTGAWAQAAHVGITDIDDSNAIGMWIYGDNKGEILNFQVFSAPGYPLALSDHYVTVDFTGWRYFEFTFRENDVAQYFDYVWPYTAGYNLFQTRIDRDHVGGINVYFNNLAVGETSNCYISLVHALSTQSVSTAYPSITIGGQQTVFNTTLYSGQYIEVDSLGNAKQYDADGFLLGTVGMSGNLPMLAHGYNSVSYSCNSSSPAGYKNRMLITFGTSDHQAENVSTVGSWSFEEASGATAVDASRYLNNGTLVNAPSRVTGVSGSALQFNGSNTSVSVPASDNLTHISGSFTVQLWFKYNGAGTAGKGFWTLLNKNAGGSGYADPFHLYIASNNLHLYARVGNGSAEYYLDSGVAINDGEFHHAALVYDDAAKTYVLYLDGTAVDTQEVPSSWVIAHNSDALTLGCWPIYSNYFNGIIDEVQIRTYPMTESEIEDQIDNTPPTVSVVSPVDSSEFEVGGTIQLRADASDPDAGGSIGKVAFYQGSTWIADGVLDDQGDYVAMWTDVANADAYAITARAIDDTGAIAISETVNVYSPVAWWKLDDGSGTSATDSTEKGHTGTLVNGPTWTTGLINGALAFNGSNSYVSVPSATSLKYVGGDMTLSTWVYVNSTDTTSSYLISKP